MKGGTSVMSFIHHMLLLAMLCGCRLLMCGDPYQPATHPSVGAHHSIGFTPPYHGLRIGPRRSHTAVTDLHTRADGAASSLSKVCIVGGGLAGLSVAYWLTKMKPDITLEIIDEAGVGQGGASAVAAGLLHPFSPKCGIIWRGEECLEVTKELIREVQGFLDGASSHETVVSCDSLFRPIVTEQNEEIYRKAVEKRPDLVQWATLKDGRLMQREQQDKAEGGSDGILIKDGLAVDTIVFLRGLWKLICSRDGATRSWRRMSVRSLSTLRELDAAFDVVCLCNGVGMRYINGMAGLLDGSSLSFVRGQTLEYDTSGRELHAALLCGEWVVPRHDGKAIGGATKEYSQDDLDAPPDAAKAEALLAPKLKRIYAPLSDLPVTGCTSGVRVLSPRTHHGRIPTAGRVKHLPSGEGDDAGLNNVWLMTALGARGLLWAPWLGRCLAEAILSQDETILPDEVRALI